MEYIYIYISIFPYTMFFGDDICQDIVYYVKNSARVQIMTSFYIKLNDYKNKYFVESIITFETYLINLERKLVPCGNLPN